YVLRDMISPEGSFYSAEDADSEGEEGKFYLWSMEELEKILGKEELDLVTMVFNIEQTGNFLEESTGKKTGSNIFYLKSFPDGEVEKKVEEIRRSVFKFREKRIHPHKDDKILTDWNGLMIVALAKAGIVFQEIKYLKIAKNTVNFLLSHLRDANGKILHRYKDGSSEIQGYLDDYVFFIWGLIELYETTFNTYYLKTALELHKIQIEDFWDEDIGGFYFTSKTSKRLLTRQKEIYDGAIPSGNSIAMLNLLRLSYITGDHELEEKADILSRVFAEKVKARPLAYTQFLVAIDFTIGPTYSLVIAGDSDAVDTKKLIDIISNEYIPNKVFILRRTEQDIPDIDKYSNFVEFFYDLEGKCTAYVCINKTCKPPTSDPLKIIEFLNGEWNLKNN
ncbi:MAG: thioredoxin domain-containing protein, partial [Promethearchaeota archaeon]